MSLPRDREQGSLFQVSGLLEPLFAHRQRRRFGLFYEQVMPALWAVREKLERLYSQAEGRPAIDPVVLAGVTLLQFMERAPDRQAAEQVALNLGWKCALGLPLEYEGFHPTTLVVFRKRLVEGKLQRAVFDAVLDVLQEAGLIKRRSKQRPRTGPRFRQGLDSTHIVGCVAQMGTVELVRETVRLALEAIRGCGREALVPGWELLWERYCEGSVDWRKQDKAKLLQKLQQAGEDADGILRWWEQQDAALPEGAQEQLELLQRVFAERFTVDGDGVQQRRRPPSAAVQNPHDPDAQWACKDPTGNSAWVGYKAQLMETAPEKPEPKQKGEPTQEFLTEVNTTEAIASDLDGMGRALQAQEQRGQSPPSELFADAAYVTDDTLHDAQESGGELVGPARPAPEHQKVFPSDCFDVDNARRKAICPAGKVSTQCSHIRDRRQGNEYYRYEWGNQCDDCPLQRECTRAKSGRRTLAVGIHHDLLQARRREMETDAFTERMKQRNAIEGTISELKRGYGFGRARYKGLHKTTLANYFIGAACNVRRWLTRTLWEMDEAATAAVA